MAYKHKGFWHPMDTVRDRDTLDKLGSASLPPWMDFANGQPVLSTDARLHQHA
ncbi:hypothetical protein ACFSHP_22730 [Novosphingobium panipatense]